MTRRRPSVSDAFGTALSELLALQLELGEQREELTWNAQGEHLHPVRPLAYEQALHILESRGGTSAMPYEWPTANLEQVSIRAIHVALECSARSLFAEFADPRHQGWLNSLGRSHAWPSDLSLRVSKLENMRDEFAKRLRRLESTVVTTKSAGIDASVVSLDHITSRFGPVVARAFAVAFGTSEPTVKFETAAEDSDFPLVAVVDARHLDARIAAGARARGARGQFYREIARELPDVVLDKTDFEFLFPTHGLE